MYSAVSSVKGLVKVRSVVTDNVIFQLHYRLTCLILIIFSIIVTTGQFYGDPIDCFTSMNEIPSKVLDDFCWIQSTFSLPSAQNLQIGTDVVYPGMDKFTQGQDQTYHNYYQWVGFFLMFQAVLFYVPHYLWKIMERHELDHILMGLNRPIFDNDSDKESKLHLVAHYLQQTLGFHALYGYGFFFCEILNFVNVVSQIFFTDALLGGEFTTYGTEVIQFSRMDQKNRTDPMIQVFPRATKCVFYKYGPSGSIQNHDAYCVLPVNIINEKIFIFLWFWYVILSIVSGLVVLYRLALVVSKKLRMILTNLRHKFSRDDDHDIKGKMATIIRKCGYGDWYIIYLLGKNISGLHFGDFILELYRLYVGDNDADDIKDGKLL